MSVCISVYVFHWGHHGSGITARSKSEKGIQKASNLEEIIESLFDDKRDYPWASSSP